MLVVQPSNSVKEKMKELNKLVTEYSSMNMIRLQMRKKKKKLGHQEL